MKKYYPNNLTNALNIAFSGDITAEISARIVVIFTAPSINGFLNYEQVFGVVHVASFHFSCLQAQLVNIRAFTKSTDKYSVDFNLIFFINYPPFAHSNRI